jgi:hypothetical protein
MDEDTEDPFNLDGELFNLIAFRLQASGEAFAAYRMGDHAGIQQHLAGIGETSALPPGQRAVVAGLLSLTGKADRAYQIAEKIPAMVLLDEERAFLQKAL